MLVENNFSFIKKIAPNKAIFFAFLMWSILFFTSPLTVNIELSVTPYIFIFLSWMSFFIGGLFFKTKNQQNYQEQISVEGQSFIKQKRLFNAVFYIAIAGLSLKLIDRFFIRGVSLGEDFIANREIMAAAGGNPLGVLSALVSPFCYFPLFYYMKYKFKMTWFKKVIIYILYFGQVFDSLLLSSRSGIFINIIFFLLFLLYFKTIRITRRTIIIGTITAILFASIMVNVFIQRTATFTNDPYEQILYYSNFNASVTSNTTFQSFFTQASDNIKPILLGYISTVQYFVHGMIEFSYEFDHFYQSHSMGKYTFVTYYRLINTLLGNSIDLEKISALSSREGVYTTLLGPLFIDFGWFTLLFMTFAGYYVRKIYSLALKGIDWAIIMYFYFWIVLTFWPVFNFINGAGGIFILTSLIILSFVSTKKRTFQ